MLIEQAFMSLPEIMVGAGYARQDYEAGVVSALSMAVLQELNGRNINKPISCICAERKYLDDRALRADLHVNLSKTFSGSAELSNFGFRFSNWIEAKYFRKTKGTPPTTTNLANLAVDLLRLMMLPKVECGQDNRSITGRYLLHVYEGDPLYHINPNRKKKGVPPRKWPKRLHKAGSSKIDSLELDIEGKNFLDILGSDLKDVTCKLNVTNFVLKPATRPKEEKQLTAVLTRIDAFTLVFEGRKTVFRADRTSNVKKTASFDELRAKFATKLKGTKESEKADLNQIGDEEYSENGARGDV